MTEELGQQPPVIDSGEFLADPALRRIVQTLGATIERVEPHTSEE